MVEIEIRKNFEHEYQQYLANPTRFVHPIISIINNETDLYKFIYDDYLNTKYIARHLYNKKTCEFILRECFRQKGEIYLILKYIPNKYKTIPFVKLLLFKREFLNNNNGKHNNGFCDFRLILNSYPKNILFSHLLFDIICNNAGYAYEMFMCLQSQYYTKKLLCKLIENTSHFIIASHDDNIKLYKIFDKFDDKYKNKYLQRIYSIIDHYSDDTI